MDREVDRHAISRRGRDLLGLGEHVMRERAFDGVSRHHEAVAPVRAPDEARIERVYARRVRHFDERAAKGAVGVLKGQAKAIGGQSVWSSPHLEEISREAALHHARGRHHDHRARVVEVGERRRTAAAKVEVLKVKAGGCSQTPSEVIKSHQEPSRAIGSHWGHRKPSEATRRAVESQLPRSRQLPGVGAEMVLARPSRGQ